MTNIVRPFDGPGAWLRGNMHGHTTNSDGEFSPAEARRWYADNGYDFLAITDHIHLTPPKADDAPGLIQIPGSEIHIGGHDRPEFHIVALGGNIAGLLEHYRYAMPPQEVLDRAAEVGAVTFVAHPYRHSLTRAELAPLTGALGIEIWNSVSERYGKALSTVVWDELLDVGWRGWGLANDDVHWRNNEQGMGWTMVKAHERSMTGVLDALKAGRFYASTGPAIHDLAIEGREVYVACSPASAVRFIGNRWHCTGVRAQAGAQLSEASVQMPAGAHYVRVEVVDARGKVAWSNPLWFDDNELATLA
jgi:hypothetical protein